MRAQDLRGAVALELFSSDLASGQQTLGFASVPISLALSTSGAAVVTEPLSGSPCRGAVLELELELLPEVCQPHATLEGDDAQGAGADGEHEGIEYVPQIQIKVSAAPPKTAPACGVWCGVTRSCAS